MTPARSRFVPLLIGIAIALALLAMNFGDVLAGRTLDPDDPMRLVQVRDFLAGQGWFDLHQYRIDPPDGVSMHWSRLVDVPIAAAIAFLDLFLPHAMAERWAAALLPLAMLVMLAALLGSTTRKLAGEKAAWVAVAMLPFAPMLVTQFLPLRIDHHGWQIILAGVAMRALVALPSKDGHVRWPVVAGLSLALWLHISLEALPFAAFAGAIYGWFWLRDGRREAVSYLGALTLGSLLLIVATRLPTDYASIYCDAIGWPLIAAFGLCGSGMVVGNVLSPRFGVVGRLIPLGLAAALGAALFLLSKGSCAIDPFAELDPLARHYWYDNVSEGLPFGTQPLHIQVLILFFPIAGLIATVFAIRQRPHEAREDSAAKARWIIAASLIAMAGMLSLFVMRTAAMAQLFALPALGWLVVAAFARTAALKSVVSRLAAMLGIVALATPVGVNLVASRLATEEGTDRAAMVAQAGQCSLDRLAALDKGIVFAGIDLAPEILARTDHAVHAAGYHRAQRQIADVIRGFLAKPQDARAIVERSGADYVVLCTAWNMPGEFAKDAPDGLAARMLAHDFPDWLEPIDLGSDAMVGGRVKRAQSSSESRSFSR